MDVFHRGAYIGVIEYILGDVDIALRAFHETCREEVTEAVRRHLIACEIREGSKEPLDLPGIHRCTFMAMTESVHIE